MPKQTNYKWVYVFGSVCPATGQTHGWLMPYANTWVMNLCLADFSRNLPHNVHVLLVLDRAGWHNAATLSIPSNISLLLLPPYSPELNPTELIWRELRQKKLSNRVYPNEDALWDAVENAWLSYTDDCNQIRNLCDFPWIHSACINCN